MVKYCPDCFGEMTVYHNCGLGSSKESQSDNVSYGRGSVLALPSVVIIAPFFGFILDLALPLPSSVIHSLILSILGSALVAFFWVIIKYRGSKSPKFLLFNIRNFLWTPQVVKIFSAETKKRTTSLWLSAVLMSTALQVVYFSPGNSVFLEHQITNKIYEASGATLVSVCPTSAFHLYNKRIVCRVKTGILGISVPARIQLSPWLGTADAKVSLI